MITGTNILPERNTTMKKRAPTKEKALYEQPNVVTVEISCDIITNSPGDDNDGEWEVDKNGGQKE